MAVFIPAVPIALVINYFIVFVHVHTYITSISYSIIAPFILYYINKKQLGKSTIYR